jgi:hypothetical protein
VRVLSSGAEAAEPLLDSGTEGCDSATLDHSVSIPDLNRRVALDDFVREVQKYRVRDVLLATNAVIRNKDAGPREVYTVSRGVGKGRHQRFTQTLVFGQHTLAFIAKQSLIHGSDLRSTALDDAGYAELISLHGNLDDGLVPDGTRFDTFGFLLRTAFEQFSYQDPLSDLIPRYFTLFKTINTSSKRKVVDVPKEFERRTGLSIEDFMVLGFAMWALAAQHSLVYESAFGKSQVTAIRDRAEGGNLARLLHLISADYESFRRESNRWGSLDQRGAKTEFNALRTFPVIRLKKDELVAPIPQLVIERVTRGIFHIMQSDMSQPKGNPFTEQFGYDFEEYVGFLLEKGYGAKAIVHEPMYGKEVRHGPDWIVREGSTMVLLECTGSSTTLATKSFAEFDAVAQDMLKIYAGRIRQFPRKIEALRSGAAGVDCTGVERFIPAIVTHEPNYIEPVLREYLAELLKGEASMLDDVKLIDIGDLEVVTGWPQVSMTELLDEWADVYSKEPQSFRPYLENKARAESLRWRNPYLSDVFDSFFRSEITPDWKHDPDIPEST